MKLSKTFAPAIFIFLFCSTSFSQTGTFISFDVQPCEGNIVLIQWSVTADMDTLVTEVERSRDKITWEKISQQAAQSSHQYYIIDSRPVNGVSYYRVRQTGTPDNTCTSVKGVQISKNDELYIWPNPTTDILHVKTPFNMGNIEILDVEGKPVQKIVISSFSTDVAATSFKKGIYYLHIRNGEDILIQRFVKE